MLRIATLKGSFRHVVGMPDLVLHCGCFRGGGGELSEAERRDRMWAYGLKGQLSTRGLGMRGKYLGGRGGGKGYRFEDMGEGPECKNADIKAEIWGGKDISKMKCPEAAARRLNTYSNVLQGSQLKSWYNFSKGWLKNESDQSLKE